MIPSGKSPNPKTPRRGRDLGIAGGLIPLGTIAFASASGGLTAAVTIAGRTSPTSASLPWIGVFLCGSLLLTVWGLLFSELLRRNAGMSRGRALKLGAICHLPLLMGLVVIRAVYADDAVNYLFSSSAYGLAVYRPMTIVLLVVVPAALQATVVAILVRRWLVQHLDVAAILAVALLLRLWSIDWQLPFQLHNDERAYLATSMMSWAHGDPNPHRFINPSVMIYLDMALFNLLGGGLFETFRVFAEYFGRQVSDPTGMYLVVLASRSLVAIMGAATALLVYVAGKELFGRRAGLLAGSILAVCFLHVRNSHYGTNDVAATFFAAASFLYAVRLYHTGRLKHYLWAGILGGLATSTKYNAGMFIFPIFAAHMARQKGIGLRSMLAPRRLAPLVASYAISAAAFVLGTPFSILDWPNFIREFTVQVGNGPRPWFGQTILPTWWMHLTTLVQGFGLVPVLLVLLGVLVLLRRSPARLALVCAFPAVYIAFMSTQQLFFVRFAIPYLPFLAILAGYGMEWIAERITVVRYRGIAMAALLAIVLVQPAVFSVQSDLITGRPDTRVMLDRWFSTNLPKGSVVLLDDISDLRKSQGWSSFGNLEVQWFDPRKDPASWKSELRRPLYLVISSFGYDGIRRGVGDLSVLPEMYKPTEEEGHLVAIFAEGYGGRSAAYSLDDSYTPFWHVMEHERPGPTVRVYRFD